MSHLSFAANQYAELRRRIREDDPDLDEQTLADTLEGLTDLHDVIRAVVRSALLDEALVDGLKGRIKDMEGRLMRLQNRAELRRHLARDAMVDTGLNKIIAPDFTISVRAGTHALVVVDEAVIPPDYWEPRSPRLNRQALLNELKGGTLIEGVALSNPEPVLSVRSK